MMERRYFKAFISMEKILKDPIIEIEGIAAIISYELFLDFSDGNYVVTVEGDAIVDTNNDKAKTSVYIKELDDARIASSFKLSSEKRKAVEDGVGVFIEKETNEKLDEEGYEYCVKKFAYSGYVNIPEINSLDAVKKLNKSGYVRNDLIFETFKTFRIGVKKPDTETLLQLVLQS